MSQRSNGFDGLRLVAAAMVIFGHAYPLTGHVSPGLLANEDEHQRPPEDRIEVEVL